jgi:hypothetical protein
VNATWKSCNGAGDANSSSFMQGELIGSETNKTMRANILEGVPCFSG